MWQAKTRQIFEARFCGGGVPAKDLLGCRSSGVQRLITSLYLPKLRNMDLSYSKCLMKMPHFGEVPNLERLNLEGCVNLMLLDPSIGVLKNLLFLNLKDCKNLRSIPNNIFDLISLEYLNLSGCFKVFNNAWYLNGLDISESGYHFQSTYSIVKWIMLLPFDYFFYSTHGDLLPSLASFSCLRELDIGFCGVRKLPDAIGCVHWLERLNLEGNNFVRVPSLGELSKLVYLNLQHCKHLEYLLELPSPGVIRQDEYYRRGEMYLFNSPKLCERDQSCSMTLSWMIKFIQAHQESSVSFDCVHIVIPGSEMPSWFDNRSEGDSIQIDPSPIIMHDNDFIGIAFCAVFSVAPDDPTTPIYSRVCPMTKVGFRNRKTGFGRYFQIQVTVDSNLITVQSNHMCLIYIPWETFFDFLSCMDKSHPNDINMEAYER